MVCWLRCTRHAVFAAGINRAQVTAEFTEHAAEEIQHALRAAERIVISTYQEIARWLGEHDPTTRRLIESILQGEEEHADDLTDLLGI